MSISNSKKLVVPDGLLRAVCEPGLDGRRHGASHLTIWESEAISESVCRWLSENPIVPTESDIMDILQSRVESGHLTGEEYCSIPPATVRYVVTKWQRRMFLSPEPDSPYDSILDAALATAPKDADGVKLFTSSGILLAEAYRRGKEGK